ncbi:MAG: hypothetical protein QM765_51850 [Myxococcales bacterium]
MKTAFIAAVLCLLHASTAFAQLVALTATDLTPQLATADQRWPQLAAGGGLYLAVWQEGEAMGGAKDTSIWAARVGADGKPMDPKGVLVCGVPGFQAYPAVTWTGTHFLVVWQDYRGGKDWDLYAARVTTDGKVLDPGGVALVAVPGNQIYPTVASGGGKTLVVWSDVRETHVPQMYRLYGTFVTGTAAATAGGAELGKADWPLLLPLVGFDGTAFDVIASQGTPGWATGTPFGLQVDLSGSAKPWKASFQSHSYSFAADPATGKALTFSTAHWEHGAYQPYYLAALHDPKSGVVDGQLVYGLPPFVAPWNDIWSAVTFDGASGVAVVEQVLIENAYAIDPPGHPKVDVDLIATRVDGSTGAVLDLPACPVFTGPGIGLQDVNASAACKTARAATSPAGVKVAGELGIQERQPALASLGARKSLLVYSRHAAPGKYKLYGVVLSQ